MANKISYIIQIKDQFSAASRKVARGFGGIKNAAQRATNSMRQFQAKHKETLLGASKNMAAFGAGAAVAMTPAILAIDNMIDKSVSMEDAMKDIGRVTGASKKQLTGFEETLETMSEKLGKSKEGLAKMAFEGGKLGVAIEDMEPFLIMVSKTAIAFDMVDEEAGRAIGSIQAKMGLAREETIRLLDSVNFLADNTTASGERMIDVLERTSGTMNLLGVPPEAAASMVGFADQIEVTSELAASGLNMFMNRMQRIPGMTTKMMTDPLGTVQGMLKSLAGMGPEVQAKFIQKVFGDEAGRFVKKMVSNVDLFDKTISAAFSEEKLGSMTRELNDQLDRSSKILEKFEVTSTNSMEAVGDSFKPLKVAAAKVLTPLIDKFGEFSKEHPKLVQLAGGIAIVTAGVGALAIAAAGLAAAFALISAPILVAAGVILAIGAAITAVTVYWDELKIATIHAANQIIDFINAIATPLSMMAEVLGFGEMKLPKFEVPKLEVVESAAREAPVGKIEDIIGKIQGQIEVVAGPGTTVKSTNMATTGAGLNIGMNMAE